MAFTHSASLASLSSKQAKCLAFFSDAASTMNFCVEERGLRATANQKLSPFTGKVAWRSHDERGLTRSGRVPRGVPPQSVSLSLTDSSPASGGAFNSLSLFANAHSQLPLRGSRLVRFTSFHIKPALKGEVANVVSRRGYKAAYSSLFITTPQSHFVRQLPVKGSLMPQASYET